jgi:CheY-like chemotaxis protein
LTKRVVVVDDHGPWRQRVHSILRRTSRWQIVGEAANGLSAIEQAATMAPDVILLDVELPALNGIEAARQILALTPGARILFVSAHRSWDIAEAALATGARGYVVKSYAGEELLPAMHAVVRNQRFISGAFLGPAPGLDRTAGHVRSRVHDAGFYSEDALLIESLARVAETALDAGNTVIMVTNESRRDDLHRRLQVRTDIDRAIEQGRCVWLSVAHVMSSFMVDGWPDEERFWNCGIPLMMGAARASRGDPPRVVACGEGTATMVRVGQVDAAIRLEQLWDDLGATFNCDILCGFPMRVPEPHEDRTVFDRVCGVHWAFHSQ